MNRKFLYLASSLLWLNSSNAMNLSFLNSSDPVITKPYTPGFMSQHPYISKTTQTGAAAALAYLTSRFVQTETRISPVTIGAAIGTGTFILARNSNPTFIDALLTNPLIALNHMQKVRETVVKVAKKEIEKNDSEDVSTLHTNLTAQYTKQSPLFWLSECKKEEEKDCILSRTYQPEYRKLYENAAVTLLLEKSRKQQSVNYTSFGSGGMFQDMVILTKMLCKNPKAKIDIHLIDTKYTPYVLAQNRSHNTQGEETAEITAMKARKKQFINYLHEMFPDATLSLQLHDSTKTYEQYLSKKTLNYPDVLTAADIEDGNNQQDCASGYYISLCKKTLARNPNSYNIWLNKDSNAQANLTTVYSDKKPDSKKTVFETHDNQKIILFARKQNITKSPSIFSRILSFIFG